MPPKPGPSPVGEPGKADPETPAGDEDKDAKAAKLRERVRERLKARQAATAAVPDAAGAPPSKRDREISPSGAEEADAKRRKTAGEAGPSGPRPSAMDGADFVDPETENRRRRVEAWRAGRKALGAKKAFGGDESDASEGDGTTLGGSGRPPWSRLEDESDEDGPGLAAESVAGDGGDKNESADEVDPLEAFMSLNDSVMDAEREAARRRREEKEASLEQKKAEKQARAVAAETEAQFAAAAARAARAAAGETAEVADDAPPPNPAAGDVPGTTAGDELDPLDAFMAENDAKANAMVAASRAAEAKLASATAKISRPSAPAVAGGLLLKPARPSVLASAGTRTKPPPASHKARRRGAVAVTRRFFDADSDADSESSDGSASSRSGDGSGSDADSEDDAAWARKQTARAASKAEKLGVTDHASVAYAPFRKNFYIESYEIKRMTEDEVAELRSELEGIRCRGRQVPRPIKTWAQAGVSNRVMELIRRSGFEKPTPIQCQALPAIMSGRDCVGVAKTGSGKTLAYILPMLRHAKDQPLIKQGDGPIAMIIGPTRELVTQIGKDCRKFGRAAGLVAVSVYGGSGVAAQIGALKRGCEIVACTPGRMIDVLTTGGGRITNLRRVTYVVLDEADRMFDMGFEPQITRIANNLRPDRQTVMFSATFPRAMEALARAALTDPVEITVGGKSVVNSDIEQIVEMREEKDRFLRALELLGEWYERGKIILFVSSQEKCDRVFRDLLRAGYPCLSLHGGKEQSDRECTVADFKSDVCNILVATSVAARGLDVKDLRLVINYDTPNHLEDYVHRVGRTGRAGNKGTAVTFISEEEERFAPDLVKAMTDARRAVPADLREMAERYDAKRKKGAGEKKRGGFGGSGFAFSREERDAERRARKAAAQAAGVELDDDAFSDDDDDAGKGAFDDDGEPVFASTGRVGVAAAAAAEEKSRAAAAGTAAREPAGAKAPADAAGTAAADEKATAAPPPPPSTALAVAGAAAGGAGALALGGATTGAARAAAFAAALAAQHAAGVGRGGSAAAAGVSRFESELEINDFPQKARWNVTHKDSLAAISEFTGAVITTRGQYIPPGKQLPIGERKLHLLIEGPTERSVKDAKGRIKEIIEQAVAKESLPGGFGSLGKYKI
jgi:ATP-dependent RNA helicase DDX46/PRP5